jgi:hypothetical protein
MATIHAAIVVGHLKKHYMGRNSKDDSWKQLLKDITKILNNWDPLNVSKVIDNEYESIGHQACSALINEGTIEAIANSIQREINEGYGLDVPEQDVYDVSKTILELRKK